MTVPGLAKSPYFLGGIGAFGLAATGTIGAVSAGSAPAQDAAPTPDAAPHMEPPAPPNPETPPKKPPNHNYSFSNKIQDIGPNFETKKVSVRVNNFLDLKAGDCFNKFFPGVPDPGLLPETADSSADTYSTFYFSPEPNEFPMGCRLARFSQTSDEKVFLYKSEVIVKTEKAGWALSAGVANFKIAVNDSSTLQPQLGTLTFEFRLLLMEKTASAWYVKGGYAWNREVSYAPEGFSNLTIYGSGSQDKWLDKPLNELLTYAGDSAEFINLEETYSDESKWHTHRTYSGIWRAASGSSGKEIFEEDPVIRKWGLTDDEGRAFPQAPTLPWDYHNKNWRSAGVFSPVDLSSIYNPFKGKRGEWKDARSYCGSVKDDDPDTMNSSIRDLCFSKNT